jgi:hypothetical protein
MPNRFQSIAPTSDLSTIVNAINQNFAVLDNEAVTKKFGSNDNTVIIGAISGTATTPTRAGMVVGDITKDGIFYGRYADSRYGTLYYQDGVPVRLDGMAPDDGRMGSWQVNTGQNVITQLGG